MQKVARASSWFNIRKNLYIQRSLLQASIRLSRLQSTIYFGIKEYRKQVYLIVKLILEHKLISDTSLATSD